MSQQIRNAIVTALIDIAPEIEVDELVDDIEYREEFDIDSMDFLNFVIAVAEHFAIEIPEADYDHIQTIAGFVAYVAARA